MIILSKLSKQAPTSQAKPEQGEGVEEKKKKREGGIKKKMQFTGRGWVTFTRLMSLLS